MSRGTGHPAARHALLFGALFGVSVAMTWPLVLHLRDHVIAASYFWDAYTNTMLMSSRARALLGDGPGGIYENYFFAPITNTIAFNENLFGLSLIFLPFYALTRDPLLSYNLVLIVSLALSAYFTCLLVQRLSGSLLAGLISGVAFAFSPYVCFELGRIQLVATQWIPLFFLCLHRAAEEKRLRDVVGLGVAYVLQVGTCLYYAMFMLPLAGLLLILLAFRHRPFPRRFLLQAAGVGLCSGLAILGMVFPYFAARKAFSLMRSEDFAQDFDGKLGFLVNVHPSNKLLAFLHHVPISDQGAHEEVAFPGFTLVIMSTLALALGVFAACRRGSAWRILFGLPAVTLAAGALAFYVSKFAHSVLPGALILVVLAVVWAQSLPNARPLQPPLSSWVWLLLLAIALFLGFVPFKDGKQTVHGLYYYLHSYVPGFDGIRKVSRQAVMIDLCFAVLGGIGAAQLFERVRPAWLRLGLAGALFAFMFLELRNAPFDLWRAPAGDTVPGGYRFIAKQPGHRMIGSVPSSWGNNLFVGGRGLAIHNYLALFHGRRMLDGKSSWIPPVAHLYNRTTRALPQESALRIIQVLNPQYLVVHRDEIGPGAAALRAGLEGRRDMLRRVYEDHTDSVYELLPSQDKSLGLLPTPPIDQSRFEPIARGHVSMTTNRFNYQAPRALDGDPTTKWATNRVQAVGDHVEFVLDGPRELAALDFTDNKITFDTPAAFKLEVSNDGENWQTVFERPRIRFYYAQVFHPSDYLFRVVLPKPVTATHLRLTLLEAMPRRWWTIYEAKLWATKAALKPTAGGSTTVGALARD